MSNEKVYVEYDAIGPIRVFRSDRAAADISHNLAWSLNLIKLANRAWAVQVIRMRVFHRDSWACVHCSNGITWSTGHMHERQARGDIRLTPEGYYSGGEISLENSCTLCYHCHLEDDNAHGKRRPQFSQVK